MSGIAAPSDEELTRRHAEIAALIAGSDHPQAWRDAFGQWDATRRSWSSWANLTQLRYAQDTRRDDYREAQRALDRRTPQVTALDKAVKRRLLSSAGRRALGPELGSQAFALWDADVTAFDESIAADLVREAELTHEYTELLARASVPFDGAERSLGELGVYFQATDPAVRHAAERARWTAFSERAERLDGLFDELVRLRDRMARALGFENFIALGYRRMRRVDFGPLDVAAYRDEIARVVVPYAHELVRRFGREGGRDPVYFWDEVALGRETAVAPLGDVAWMLANTREAFERIDPSLGAFAAVMLEQNLFDVGARPGKALGAYCTDFPTRRHPFVFGNFQGSSSDVRTLVHELGHAFQHWQSRDKAAMDYMNPTYESAEIHSMSLEYLAWPEMERFFGAAAGAYRREHLLAAMLFLPYGAAVDHFQHLVYAHPGATPGERNAMWQEMERRYLPWRNYGDLAHPAAGGLWQEKRHIYLSPFYYIDYTLALSCALQFWAQAESDREAVLDAYVALCARGGEAPFRELVRSAGLRVPFEGGVLEDVVRAAAEAF
jgi:M3 family oligoendopeptidase